MSVFAVIILFNPDYEKLNKQKDSIRDQVDGIVYVDNGRFDVRLNSILEDPLTILIRNNANLGIAEAQNIGIKYAIQKGATHILLLDQDSITSQNLVGEMLIPFGYNEKIGVVGPKLIDAYNVNKDCQGMILKGFKIKTVSLKEKFTEVSYLIASGSLIPVKVLNDVGLMDSSFFIDGVDFEWCLRAKYKGYKIIQSRDAHLIHELGNGKKDRILSHSPQREYYIIRNSIKMSRMRHIPFAYRIRRFTMSIMRVISCLRPSKTKFFKCGVKGLKDGLKCN